VSIKKLLLPILLIGSGIWLWLYRMSVVYATVGKTRTRLGRLFGVDQLHFFILGLKLVAVGLILSGLLLALRCGLGSRKAK